MIVTLCLNPTLQKTMVFKSFTHGEVNRAVLQRWDASGKGVNVSRVLSQLGCAVLHITQLGGRNRAWFTDLLLEDGIPLRYVPSPSEIRGCYTVLEEEPFCMTELVEEGDSVSPETEAGIRQAFLDAIAQPETRAVIISGSKAKGFSTALFPNLVRAALEKGLLCVADYRGEDLLNTLDSCTLVAHGNLIIKPNFEEFCESFFSDKKRDTITDGQLHKKMADLYRKYGCKSVITRGDKPVQAFDGEHFYTADLFPLPVGECVRNTIGCGDAFTAGFTAALCGYLPADNNNADCITSIKTMDCDGKQGNFPATGIFARALAEANRCGSMNACTIKPGSLR